jgi:hypothetical protein
VIARAGAGVLALLFLLSALVQLNDPDPLPWMAIYGAAAVVAVWHALRPAPPAWPAWLVASIAAAWAASIVPRIAGRVRFSELWGEVGMKTPAIEEGREATGLAIVALAMIGFAIRGMRMRRRR